MLGNAATASGRHDVGSRIDRSAGAETCAEQLVTRRVVEMKGDRRSEIPDDVLPSVDPVEDLEQQGPQEQRLITREGIRIRHRIRYWLRTVIDIKLSTSSMATRYTAIPDDAYSGPSRSGAHCCWHPIAPRMSRRRKEITS